MLYSEIERRSEIQSEHTNGEEGNVFNLVVHVVTIRL
jgi:hypothetical protein